MKKIIKFSLIFVLTIGWIFIAVKPGLNQSGTQSNTTVPNPQEINPQPVEVKPESPQSSLSDIKIDRTAFEQNFQQASFDRAVQMFEELQAVEFGKYFGTNFFGKTASPEQISQTLCNLAETTGKKAALLYVVSLEKQLELLLIIPNSTPCTKASFKQNGYQSKLGQGNPTPNPSPQQGGEYFPPSPRSERGVRGVRFVPAIVGSKQNNNPTLFIRKSVPEANRKRLQTVAKEFRSGVTDPILSNDYRNFAKQFYQWIIAPVQSDLAANKIDSLIFSMDAGLRSVPVAAFNNGQQFLIEQYNVALIPSFSLTDTRYIRIANSQMLAMGISKSTQDQSPLPAVAVEVPTLANILWRGQAFLNEESTLEKLQSLSRQQHFEIIHIATHAEFRSGKVSESYIQFWNSKLKLDQLQNFSRKLAWNKAPKVEMLVLSACRTALGNEQAELGFAGLAVQAGVKTAVGSLWYASDEGSLALMTEFYHKLRTAPIKTEALRDAQLGMLKGQVRLENGQLILSDNRRVSLPPELATSGDINLSHPYFWSGYTMIGNWN
ncbi:CHAT domain-containing protein [Argonema galeatum]|uniref:CHAT domain-containing protein n=1 Tax=Argonema galeatum TaxID=2942762 RepID=UPI00201254ED|nr:CHAT domain-containing protein [Argonema galeatum]MCL1464640.1 CHAT domain-containing protein [Argonema galeatum A003/A1]